MQLGRSYQPSASLSFTRRRLQVGNISAMLPHSGPPEMEEELLPNKKTELSEYSR